MCGVVLFPSAGLAAVASALGKRHDDTESTLRFSRASRLTVPQLTTAFPVTWVRVHSPRWLAAATPT